MERPVKRLSALWKGIDARARGVAATAAFVMLSLMLIYGGIRLFQSIRGREAEPLKNTPPAETAEGDAQNPASTEPASEEAASGAYEWVPAQTEEPDPTPAPTAEAIPGVAQRTVQAGRVEDLTPVGKTEFRRGHMDVLLLGFDSAGCLDTAVLAAMREKTCTFIFLPKNLVDGSGQPISRLKTASTVIRSLKTVLPLEITHYAFFRTERIGDCVGALGGVTADGRRISGEEAEKLLTADGSDELIRVEKLQKLLVAAAEEITTASLLRIAALKPAVGSGAGGNLAAEQYLSLFKILRQYGTNAHRALLIPVDSTVAGGRRCYRTDAKLTEALIKKHFS